MTSPTQSSAVPSPDRVTPGVHDRDPGQSEPGGVIGVVGVGKLGAAIGRLVIEAGHELLVTDTPDHPHLELIVGSVLPQADLVDLTQLAERSDIVILALPQAAVWQLDPDVLAGSVVIDATNAWDAIDPVPDAARPSTTEDLAVARPGWRLVKTLNQLGYADVLADARPSGSAGRVALGVAGDDPEALAAAARFVDSLGFDPVPTALAGSRLLEPDGPVFGRKLRADDLRDVLA